MDDLLAYIGSKMQICIRSTHSAAFCMCPLYAPNSPMPQLDAGKEGKVIHEVAQQLQAHSSSLVHILETAGALDSSVASALQRTILVSAIPTLRGGDGSSTSSPPISGSGKPSSQGQTSSSGQLTEGQWTLAQQQSRSEIEEVLVRDRTSAPDAMALPGDSSSRASSMAAPYPLVLPSFASAWPGFACIS